MQIDVLGERYQIQDPIGRGGMATIYRGRDLRTDHIVAIKILREVFSTDPKFVTRFQREAKAASSLQHPNIVQVYDYGHSEGNYFIVMEYIEGTDLRRYLRSRGMLAVDRAVIIAHDIALGLGAAHRRSIVHRDVKPQNILVGRDGSIKLTDFGIASVYKDINDERLTTTGMTLGTVQYYAPEQAQGEIVNPAADVYALGIVMYEMLAGRTPFDGDTPVAVAMQHIQDVPVPPSQFNPNIPPALEGIIMRCLEKIPEMRYRDGNSLARAIESLGGGDGGGLTLASTSSGGSTETSSSSNRRDGFTGNRSGTTPNTSDQLGQQYSPANNSGSPVQDVEGGPSANAANGSRAGGYPQLSTEATMHMDQPAGSYDMPAPVGAGSTLPLPKGIIGRRKESDELRVVTIVTLVILVATLLLIGFSVYLLSALGFISLPGVQAPAATPTLQPTPANSTQSTATAQPTSQPTPGGTPTPVITAAPAPTPTRMPTPTPPPPTPTPTPTLPLPTPTLPLPTPTP
jgi:serine/threonine-protein kinase